MALESWMVEVESQGLVKVASALELCVDGQILCTGCGLPLESDFSHWRCPACSTRGNALMYAALALEGGRKRADRGLWRAVREALAAHGLCRAA